MTNNTRSENCSNCQKRIAELEKDLIKACDENSYQYRQHEDEISRQIECVSWYQQCMESRAKLEALRDKYSSAIRSMKMLGQVGDTQARRNQNEFK